MGLTILTGSVLARTARAEIKSPTFFFLLPSDLFLSWIIHQLRSYKGCMRKSVPLWLLSSAVSVLCPLTHGLTFHSMDTGLVWCKKIMVYRSGGSTLAGLQVPTKSSLSLPSSAGWGRKCNRLKGWGKGREWGTFSKYYHAQNRFDLGKLTFYQSIQSRVMRNKS